MKPCCILAVLISLWSIPSTAQTAPYEFTPLNYPDPDVNYLIPEGLSGNTVVGQVSIPGTGISGFVFDGATWKTFTYQGTSATTRAYDVQGSKIVGAVEDPVYGSFGFIYDFKMETWTKLQVPGKSYTGATGIDGTKIVGWYPEYHASAGFLYDVATGDWKTFTYPLFPGEIGSSTRPQGISGNYIVGSYQDPVNVPTPVRTFLYDYVEGRWSTLKHPEGYFITAYGIDGTRIVGYYLDRTGNHGFIYDFAAETWTTIDYPGLLQKSVEDGTFATDLDGESVLGFWRGVSGGELRNQAFIAAPTAVPEPPVHMLLFLALGGVVFLIRRSLKGNAQT